VKTVRLPARTPRDPKVVRSHFDIGHMLRPRALVGWLFLVGGVLVGLPIGCLAVTGESSSPPGPIVVIALQAVLGWVMVASVRRRRRQRLRALTHGALTQATVVKHGFAIGWGILLKRLNTVISVEVPVAGGTSMLARFSSPLPGLRRHFPIGTHVQALVDVNERAVLIPAEYDTEVELDWQDA
jgi:hypothetical protein